MTRGSITLTIWVAMLLACSPSTVSAQGGSKVTCGGNLSLSKLSATFQLQQDFIVMCNINEFGTVPFQITSITLYGAPLASPSLLNVTVTMAQAGVIASNMNWMLNIFTNPDGSIYT